MLLPALQKNMIITDEPGFTEQADMASELKMIFLS